MNILVLGAGAIGMLFGGFLAKSNHRVTLLGRKENVEPVNSRGIFLEGIWGDHQVTNVKGYADFVELRSKEGPRFDLALLTVKAYDTEKILQLLFNLFADPPPVVSLQNGLGNLEQIIQLLGRDRAMAGRIAFEAAILEPGKVKVTEPAEEVKVGGVENGIAYGMVKHMAELLTDAGIRTVPTTEIERYIWSNVLFGTALNGLGAILGVNYGFLSEHEAARKLISSIVQEFFLILEKENKKVDWPDSETYLRFLFEEVIPSNYNRYSSMVREIENGKKTEIDAFNGAIVEVARSHGFEVPINWLITELVKVKEKIGLRRKDQ